MTKNHSQWHQPSLGTLSLRCSFFLPSPLLPFLPLQMSLSLQMLFGKLSPVHIHSYLLFSLLHRCCLALSYPSPLPLLFLLSAAALHPHLYTPSLLLHLLFFTRFCLSLSQFPFLSPPLVPSLPSTLSLYTHPTVQTLHFPLVFLPSFHTFTLFPSDLSCSDNETLRCKISTCCFGWRGRVTVTCS